MAHDLDPLMSSATLPHETSSVRNEEEDSPYLLLVVPNRYLGMVATRYIEKQGNERQIFSLYYLFDILVLKFNFLSVIIYPIYLYTLIAVAS